MTTATHLVLERLHRPAPILGADLPPSFDSLVRQGLVKRGETARGLACGHCEEGCWVEPLLHRHPRDGMILVHPCVGAAEGGLLAYEPEALHTWALEPGALAEALGAALELVGRPEERVPERVWWLGERRADRRRDVYLVAGLGLHAESIADDTIDGVQGLAPIALVPWGTAPELAAEVVPLHDLLTIGPTGVRVDRERFDARLRPARPRKEAVRPFPLPAGAVWERLVVEVVDDEHAVLCYGEREERRSYVELGFRDGRSKDTAPRPSELWTYFLALAREDGRLIWRTPAATPLLRDRVRELRAKLSALFPIAAGVPIADYTERKAYETTFTLRRRA
jgi:hypothetical protein